jgi:hypothetical protein
MLLTSSEAELRSLSVKPQDFAYLVRPSLPHERLKQGHPRERFLPSNLQTEERLRPEPVLVIDRGYLFSPKVRDSLDDVSVGHREGYNREDSVTFSSRGIDEERALSFKKTGEPLNVAAHIFSFLNIRSTSFSASFLIA